MDGINTSHPIALSLLFNEEIYTFEQEQHEYTKTSKIDLNISVDDISATKSTPAVPVTFDYLGENNKYLLVIVNDTKATHINQTDLGFLLKILAAKKLELQDVAILNLHKYTSANFDELKNFFGCNKIITFGINPKILGIENAIANQKSLFNETAVLGTWDLQRLQTDKSKKTVFWEALKNF